MVDFDDFEFPIFNNNIADSCFVSFTDYIFINSLGTALSGVKYNKTVVCNIRI